MSFDHVPIVLKIPKAIAASPGVFVHDKRFPSWIQSVLAFIGALTAFPFSIRFASDVLDEPFRGGIGLTVHVAWSIHVGILDRTFFRIEPTSLCRHLFKRLAITRLVTKRPHHNTRMTPIPNHHAPNPVNGCWFPFG